MEVNKATESSDEIKNSPSDNDDSGDTSQGQSEESDRDPTALENPATFSVAQVSSETDVEMKDSPKDDDTYGVASEEESGRNLSTPDNQVTPVGSDASEIDVEMVDSSKDNVKYGVASEEESGRNPTTLENRDISSVRENASENQQPSSGPSISTLESEIAILRAMDPDQLCQAISFEDDFYTSRILRNRRKCSRFADALLSPRRCPSRLATQILVHSNIDSAKVILRDLATGNGSSLRPYSGFVTRNISLIRSYTEDPTARRGGERVGTGMETASGSISRAPTTSGERLDRRTRDSNAMPSPIAEKQLFIGCLDRLLHRVSSEEQREQSGGNPPPSNLEGQPSTSGHQSQIRDDSYAGDRARTSSGVIPPGDTSDRVAESEASGKIISKYASTAQKLLFQLLEEMMELKGEKDEFKKFQERFSTVSKSPDFGNEFYVKQELLFYLLANQCARVKDEDKLAFPEGIFEYHMRDADRVLTRIVAATLIPTATVNLSLDFDFIMLNYKSFRNVHDKYIEFWGENSVENIQDEASRNRVADLNDRFEVFVLRTMSAFQSLLMHIGENARQDDIDRYMKELLEEHKKFLKRRIR